MATGPVTRGELLTLSAEELQNRLGKMSDAQIKDLFSKTDLQTLIYIVLVKIVGHRKEAAMKEIADRLTRMRDISAGLNDAAARATQADKDKVPFNWDEETISVTIDGEKTLIPLADAMAYISDPSIKNLPPAELAKKLKDIKTTLKLNGSEDASLAIQKINNKSSTLGDQIKKVAAEAQKAQSENTTFNETSSNLIKTLTNMAKDVTRNIG